MTEPVNLKLKMPSGDASDPFAGVETARLSLIDLSDLSSPAGRSRISAEIAAACRDIGFLVLVNHGISNVERQFEIAKEVFELPYEEKEKYNMGTSGNYFGYKRIGQQIINAKGDGDGNEYYNTAKASSVANRRPNPEPIERNIQTIHAFSKECHDLVLKLLGIFEEQFGLEKGYFMERHRWDAPSGDMVRMIKYPPRPDEDDVNGPRMAGHTDFGSITLLFNQNVGGLQVLQDNVWKYVRPVPGGIIVNIGDALQFWTGGALKSSMHRVVVPPGAQKQETRYSVVYFSRPEDDCALVPINAPPAPDQKIWTAGEWIKMRVVTSQKANYTDKTSFVKTGYGGAAIHAE